MQVVKSGDWVSYGTTGTFLTLLDAALARRRDELVDVKVRGNLAFGPAPACGLLPGKRIQLNAVYVRGVFASVQSSNR